MNKLYFRIAAISLFIQPFSAFSAANQLNISDIINTQVQANFGFAPVQFSAPVLPEPQTPETVPVGDFSAIRDYSFNYLNDATVKLIDASVSSIDVVMYSFTLQDMSDALLRARDRGVKVRIIMDESHIYPSMNTRLKDLIAAGGIDIRTLRGTRTYGVTHNKIGVFDKSVASSGSYNWTFSATFANFENMIILRDPVTVSGFVNYYEWMWGTSRTLEQGPSPEVPEGYYGTPPQDPAPAMDLNGVSVPAYLFSPGSATEDRLSRIIDAVRNTLDVVTFTFSSKTLADAIIAAKNRGVKVRMLMDATMAKDSATAKYVYDSGVDFRVRGGRTEKGALHNKFAILDGSLLETGSFNWTVNASVNSFENVVFTTATAAVSSYQSKYDWFYSSSTAPGADFFPQADPASGDTPVRSPF